MNILKRCFFVGGFVTFLLVSSEPANAILGMGDGPGSFEKFYSSNDWSALLGLSAALALVLGLVVFFTGGLGSPLVPVGVKAVATWVGGWGTGLSGAAALNHGLALLGGGTVAAGGLGKAGGAALLSIALGTSAEVPIWTATELYEALEEEPEGRTIDYNKLLPQRQWHTVLPLPVNTSGPVAYEAGLKVLEKIKKIGNDGDGNDGDDYDYAFYRQVVREAIHAVRWALPFSSIQFRGSLEGLDEALPYSSPENRTIIVDAVEHLMNDLSAVEEIADASLLALLYFNLDDDERANKYAKRAQVIAYSSESDITESANLAIFIEAVTTLREEKFDWKSVIDRVEKAALSDPKNALLPLMFSILLDRIGQRINDGYLDEKHLYHVFELMDHDDIAEFKRRNFLVVLSRYLQRLEMERSTIKILTQTENETILSNPRTLDTLEESLRAYKSLLDDGTKVKNRIAVFDLEEEDTREVAKLKAAFERYSFKIQELASLVDKVRTGQV